MRYFKLSEFDQKNAPGSGANMDLDFLENIDELRHRCKFPIIISSGYRSPEYNAKVSSTGATGPHTTGKACDIKVYGKRAHRLLEVAFTMGVFTGIGVKQHGSNGGRFIHLDSLPDGDLRPWIWGYK